MNMLQIRTRPKDQSSDEEDDIEFIDLIENDTNHKDDSQSKDVTPITIHKQDINPHSNDSMIFCFYPVDVLHNQHDTESVAVRASPFDSDSLSLVRSDNPMTPTSFIVQHDESNHIYYLPFGVPPCFLEIATPNWKWPDRYTIMLWVRWKEGRSILSTFDSHYHTPIYIEYSRLGCSGKNALGVTVRKVSSCKVLYGKWQCVIAQGGNHETTFFVGDLQTVPECIGFVECDVVGQQTERFGTASWGGQGPGDVGCAMVFDRMLSDNEIEELYEDSKVEMEGACWTKEEAESVKEVLMAFVDGINEIANIVMDIVLGPFMKKYAI